MPISELRLIKRCAEHREKDEVENLQFGIRGIYALLKYRPRLNCYDLVYIGMARRNIKKRLKVHLKSKKKADMWSHFSVFEVWDNISNAEIEELEGLFRYLYKKDSRANQLNKQKGYQKMNKVKNDKLGEW